MRKLFYLLTIIVITVGFGINCSAAESVDEYISEFEDILPEEVGELSKSDTLIDKFGIESILANVVSVLSGERGRVLTFFMTLVGVIVVSALVNSVSGELSESVRAAVGILSSAAIFNTVGEPISEILLSLDKISSFFSSFIPVSVALTAFGGGEATAMVQGSGMYISLSLLSRLGGGIFSAVCSLSLAIALVSPMGGPMLSSLSSAVKGVFTRILGIFTAIITAAFSLQTLVASGADNGTMRAARYMASGLIPIVGSTVSGALSTLASGMSYAKGIIGGGAVAVILFFAISPLIILLLYRLAMTTAIGLSQILAADCAGMITAYRSALDTVLAIYSLSTLVYLFEIIVFIKSGVTAG